jgi:hypothetical protein
MKSFIYGHIHPCRWTKITLSFKLQAQTLHSCTSHTLAKIVECVEYSQQHSTFINWEYLTIEFSYNENQKHFVSHANYFKLFEGL